MSKVITRGNTVSFAFTFTDGAGEPAAPDSATLTLVHAGLSGPLTETLTLAEDDGAFATTWDSRVARGGWVAYHAHAIAGETQLTEDGRFKLSANRASFAHESLAGAGAGSDYAG